MSEIINDRQVFSLVEVMKSIQKTIADRYKSTYWIKAEMNKLNFYKQSGHCYPELVEKQDGKVIAQMRSTLWKENFNNINNNFLKILKEPLKDGIKILFLARITFDTSYGLSLNIIDIDPSYTLGDLEREKQETVDKLKAEGIYGRNKTLRLPLLPQRIAIISVETSKGYADFLSVVDSNAWNYKFFHMLFPSLLQGEKAVPGIISQLKLIKKVKSHFDVVAIIRGGGGDIGLSCYNHYSLAQEIALFPLPVITGIGHSTNETVAEMISFANAITPTKLAEYLIQKFHNFSVPVQKAEEKTVNYAVRKIKEEKNNFFSEVKMFRSVTLNILISDKSRIKELSQSLLQQSRFIFRNEKDYLLNLKDSIRKGSIDFFSYSGQQIANYAMNMRKDTQSQIAQHNMLLSQNSGRVVNGALYILRSRNDKLLQSGEKLNDRCRLMFKSYKLELNASEKNIENMSPENVLKRGYSITLLNGKAVKSINGVKSGDKINTIVAEGNINSIVESVKK